MYNTHVYGEAVAEFAEGARVALRPCSDAWMRGDRFGEVVEVGRTRVYVRLDRSGRRYPARPSDLAHMAAD
uniref:Uncharacterized protein n=1 Tax=Mycobacterium phage Pharb TaxID=3136626 RepID=A0AAU8GNY4_9VIRU